MHSGSVISPLGIYKDPHRCQLYLKFGNDPNVWGLLSKSWHNTMKITKNHEERWMTWEKVMIWHYLKEADYNIYI